MRQLFSFLFAFLFCVNSALAQYYPPSGGGVPVGYTGQTSITTLGTIVTGTWNGTAISSTYLDAQTAYKNVTNIFTLVQRLTAGATPATAGGAGLGTAALPFLDAYIGTAATNNTHVTGTVTAARTLTLPDADSNTVRPDTGASHNFLTAIASTGVISKAQPAFTDISGSVAASQLPNPSATTLGGVESLAVVSHNWINTISTSGVPAATQPAFTDISGSVVASQLPNPSATTLGGVESLAVVSSKWINTISTSGVPAATQPAFTDISGSVAAGQMPALTGDITTSAGTVATALKSTGTGAGSCTNCSVTFDAQGRQTAYSSGAGSGNVSFGGNGADSAGNWSSQSIDRRTFNFTTLTITTGNNKCPSCIVNTTGAITMTGGEFDANHTGAAVGGIGVAYAGGKAATSASTAGESGYGPAPGQGGNNTSLIGPGGGSGAANGGGSGGGATEPSGFGLGGVNGAGAASSHAGGSLDGSAGGGGGAGASGLGGDGGGGSSHITVCTAGGFSGTGASMHADGNSGGGGSTLGSGGAGGGAGSLLIYSASGNLPAITFSAVGGAGGASVSTAANSGGGGGGYIAGTVSGTTASATFTVTGGAAGTGGGGAAGSAGGTGLANIIASTVPTLPVIAFDNLNGDQAGKNMCWILLARRNAIFHKENESEKSHKFIWDGNKGEQMQPYSYVASTYAAPGKFYELCMALDFGGNSSTAELCDAANIDECRKQFEIFKSSPIHGEMPVQAQVCDDIGMQPAA